MEKNDKFSFNAYLPALFFWIALTATLFVLAFLREVALLKNGMVESVAYLKITSDAFAGSGVVFLVIPLFAFLKNEGAFTGISYAFKRVKAAFSPFSRDTETYENHRNNEKRVKKPAFSGRIGLSSILLSVLCALL